MTRTKWLSAFSCAAVLGAALSIAGCGSSPTASGKDGGAGHGGSDGGTAGATAGATGSAGNTGSAGATAGTGGGTAGATAGTGGGTAGATAGTGGGTAGAMAGAGGNKDGGMDLAADTKTDTATDVKTDTSIDVSTDVPPTPCVSGGTCTDQDFACTITRTCRRNQEQVCFCAPNNKIACEPCDAIDAGTDANTDAGTDAGADGGTDAGTCLAMCPANVMNRNTTCFFFNTTGTTGTCNATTHTEPSCICVVNGNNAGRWFCGFNTRCQ